MAPDRILVLFSRAFPLEMKSTILSMFGPVALIETAPDPDAACGTDWN
jgi:hypothetical protein